MCWGISTPTPYHGNNRGVPTKNYLVFCKLQIVILCIEASADEVDPSEGPLDPKGLLGHDDVLVRDQSLPNCPGTDLIQSNNHKVQQKLSWQWEGPTQTMSTRVSRLTAGVLGAKYQRCGLLSRKRTNNSKIPRLGTLFGVSESFSWAQTSSVAFYHHSDASTWVCVGP